jgi:hypothetical protein
MLFYTKRVSTGRFHSAGAVQFAYGERSFRSTGPRTRQIAYVGGLRTLDFGSGCCRIRWIRRYEMYEILLILRIVPKVFK